jgi:pimeloyl-ACP methyl ester carboxylesterase
MSAWSDALTEQPLSAPRASSSNRLEPLRNVDAGVLNIAYYEAGPADGRAVLLMHGFPYDVHAYVDVAPQLAAQGCRVIVPYLRGYGPTRFRDRTTPRSGEQAALGADLLALIDALGIKRAVVAGYDWGGRAACVVAALWPERCIGLVSLNSYNIQDIAKAMVPARPDREVPLWYQYYFQLERGRAGLAANRRDIAKLLWQQWSPNWQFDDACFERTAIAHDNPDYVDVVIHSYRHRFGLAEGDPRYAELQRKLAAQPPITVPTITLDGEEDGVIFPTDGRASAPKFTGPRVHRVIPRAGHNLPQEAPEAFAAAVLELIKA